MATSEGGSARENGAGVVLGYNMELTTGVTEIPFMQEKKTESQGSGYPGDSVFPV